jgi:phospholipid-binding lipoprotein MlaA
MVVVGGISACTAPPPPAEIYDPAESVNRRVHSFNVGLDKYLVRPASTAYDVILPTPIETGVSNFANNLGTPSDVLNNLLQGRPHIAAQNTFRFAINTTVGVAGLFDVATAIGVPRVSTDFGETLHVWGSGEGAYLELPVLGPSTVRDTVGSVVDVVTNPVGIVVDTPESYGLTAAQIGSRLSDRRRFASTLDSLYYESADGYAQLRLLYLQNRRFELGQTDVESDATFVDPYEDPYGE